MASAVFDLVRNTTGDGSLCSKSSPHQSRITFLIICWPFYSHVSDRTENLWEESSWLIEKKKDLFNCKFVFIFQSDGCTEPTCAATCFSHFGQSHCPDNIRLMLPFFNWNVRSCCFYLFVYLFILLVGWFKMHL